MRSVRLSGRSLGLSDNELESRNENRIAGDFAFHAYESLLIFKNNCMSFDFLFADNFAFFVTISEQKVTLFVEKFKTREIRATYV